MEKIVVEDIEYYFPDGVIQALVDQELKKEQLVTAAQNHSRKELLYGCRWILVGKATEVDGTSMDLEFEAHIVENRWHFMWASRRIEI